MRGTLLSNRKDESDFMKRVCEAVVLLIGTLGWWGFVYPDLCLTEETYERFEQEYEENEKCEKWEEEISGTIRIKSRLVEYVYQSGQSKATNR